MLNIIAATGTPPGITITVLTMIGGVTIAAALSFLVVIAIERIGTTLAARRSRRGGERG